MKGKRRANRAGLVSVFAALLWGSCAAQRVQDPLEFPQTILSEWAICERILLCLGYEPGGVGPEHFTWIAHSERFICGERFTDGCFTPAKMRIDFHLGRSWVIRHECGHAILWSLGDPAYRCFDHPEDEGCEEEPVARWAKYCSIE
jgi:hypothetical protein